MNTHPTVTEATQRGKTAFWENIRDKSLDDYTQTADGIRFWRPIDALSRRRQLRRLEQFIIRAAVIIDESRIADSELERHHHTYLSEEADRTTSWNETEILSQSL